MTPLMGAFGMPPFDLHDFLIYVALQISDHPYWTVTVGYLFLLLLCVKAGQAIGRTV